MFYQYRNRQGHFKCHTEQGNCRTDGSYHWSLECFTMYYDASQVFHDILRVYNNVINVSQCFKCYIMFDECFWMFYKCYTSVSQCFMRVSWYFTTFTMFYDVLLGTWWLTIAGSVTARLPINPWYWSHAKFHPNWSLE